MSRRDSLPTASLVLRERDGEAFYEAKFRYRRHQVKRRIGRAWLTRDTGDGWVPRRGRVAEGYFDERRAHVAAAELVRTYVTEFNDAESVERERRTRGVTFRELALGYLEWLGPCAAPSPPPSAHTSRIWPSRGRRTSVAPA